MHKDMYQHHSTIQNSFTSLKILCALFNPNAWQPLIFFSVSIALTLPESHIVGITQSVAFSDWLLSLSNMHLSFLHVFSCLDSSFLFSAE